LQIIENFIKNKLRVLHVISNFSESYAGMAIASKELAESQVKVGIRSTVITSNLDHPMGRLEKILNEPVYENGVRVIYCPVLLRSFVFSFRLIKKIKEEINNSDIIHIHGLYRFPQTFASFYSRIIGKPYLISPHGSLNPKIYNKKNRIFLRRLYQKFIENRNIKFSSIIHFTADDEKTNANFLVSSNNGVVISNGIDITKYEFLPEKGFFKNKFGIESNLFKILFLGRICEIKGLNILLPAIAEIAIDIPNIILLVVGPDYENYKEKLLTIIKELKIEQNVKFLGKLNRNIVNNAYVDSDIFVLPSYSENFGLTIIESLACGCPVIISKNVNISNEIYKHGLGQIVNTDSKEIAKEIKSFYYKTALEKQKLKQKIREFTLEYYNWNKSALAFKDLYNHLINKYKYN
jgi:glycosyltransferase involved in cell wall biosynthesis